MAVRLPHESFYAFYTVLPLEIQVNDTEFTRLWDLHPAEYGIVNVWGKDFATPRYQQPYGKSYSFSRKEHAALPLNDPYFLKIMKYCSDHTALYMPRVEFNGLLVNWYQDGQHYINFHSDDEKDLVVGSPIYSFSFGECRNFFISPKKIDDEWNKFKQEQKLDEDRIVLSLPNNSMVIMGGRMQQFYKHSIPKRSVNVCPKPRINITVRHFK
jgi:alkylated DNA repair dioxygenase AlkB